MGKVSSNQTQLEEGENSKKSGISMNILGNISNSSDSTPSSRQRRPRPHKNQKNKNQKNQKNQKNKNLKNLKNKNLKNQKNKNKNRKNHPIISQSTKTPSISPTTPVTLPDVQEYDEDDLVQAQFFFGKK